MILDSLVHVTPDGRWFDLDVDASESSLLREMDAAGIARSVVVALAGTISNSFVAELCGRHPDRLVPGGSFDPSASESPAAAAAAFREQLKGTPCQVLKLHPRLNRYSALDPRCLAVLEELSSWDRPLPVWFCSFLHYRGGVMQKPVVETFHELVGRFPALTFVILHGGGPSILALAEAVRDCPNAYLDLSFTLLRYAESSVPADLRHLLQRFDRRLLFGSDFPEIRPGEALAAFERLAAGLASEKRANVLGANLDRILAER